MSLIGMTFIITVNLNSQNFEFLNGREWQEDFFWIVNILLCSLTYYSRSNILRIIITEFLISLIVLIYQGWLGM